MLNITKQETLTLSDIPLYEVRAELVSLLQQGESLRFAFGTKENVHLAITERQIIVVQKAEENRKSYTFLPLSRLCFYTIDTEAFHSYASDPQICLLFANGFELILRFSGSVDIEQIQLLLSAAV